MRIEGVDLRECPHGADARLPTLTDTPIGTCGADAMERPRWRRQRNIIERGFVGACLFGVNAKWVRLTRRAGGGRQRCGSIRRGRGSSWHGCRGWARRGAGGSSAPNQQNGNGENTHQQAGALINHPSHCITSRAPLHTDCTVSIHDAGSRRVSGRRARSRAPRSTETPGGTPDRPVGRQSVLAHHVAAP